MSKVIVTVLSLFDILAGLLIVNHNFFLFFRSFIGYFVFYLILKGFWSLVTSIGSGYFFGWMGALDLITGVILLLMNNNVQMSFFYTLGIVEILKGCYCLLRSLLRI